MSRVVVVGGGVAGLVAARRLAAADHEVTVFEAESTVGGRVRSVHQDGWVFDRGFQVLFTAYPAVKRELALDELDMRYFTPGATIARPGRRTVLADPRRSLGDLSETLFNADVRLRDELKLLALWRRLRTGDPADDFDPDETRSIETYLSDQGFSRAFVENVARPFYGGLTLDRSLSTDAGVFRYTFRMLAAGRTAVPADGMGAIPEQLADRARDAGATIETDAAVRSLDADTDSAAVGTDDASVSADAVVVATDPGTAASLTDVSGIPTESRGCVTQYYGLPGHVDLDTGRKLLLNAGSAEPNQVAPLSAVAPEYAPDDRTLVSATWLGVPDATDEGLFEQARDALSAWYPERRFDALERLSTVRVADAQLVQPPGFRADRPDPNDPSGPVVLAGDYTQWSSIQGALESGRVAAAAVGQSLE